MTFRDLVDFTHIGQRNRLAAGAVTGHGGDDRRHVFRTLLGDGRFQLSDIEVAFPVVPGGGIERFRRHYVDGFRTVQFHMCGGSVEVEVGNKDRFFRFAARDQRREEDLFSTAPLVGWDGERIADDLFYFCA